MPTNWIKPKWEDELDEFERVSKETNLSIGDLFSCFERGRVRDLNDEIWAILEDTESFATKDLRDVIDLLVLYKKNWWGIIQGFICGDKMPMPIIMQTEMGFVLVAGNSRLCVARARGEKVKVWLMQVPEVKNNGNNLDECRNILSSFPINK